MDKKELENRLIDFSVLIIKLVDNNKNNFAGNHLKSQIIRSSTSCALNYGEAQSAESKRDFIHKMQIVLKELRETFVCRKIIKRSEINADVMIMDRAFDENDQLISIFVKSIETAKKRK